MDKQLIAKASIAINAHCQGVGGAGKSRSYQAVYVRNECCEKIFGEITMTKDYEIVSLPETYVAGLAFRTKNELYN